MSLPVAACMGAVQMEHGYKAYILPSYSHALVAAQPASVSASNTDHDTLLTTLNAIGGLSQLQDVCAPHRQSMAIRYKFYHLATMLLF